jgi:hypothetical protein
VILFYAKATNKYLNRCIFKICNMPDYLNIQPSPISLIESLREIGYSMEIAIADIMDNSITSGASSIHLRFAWNNGEPWLAIIDDGLGMSADEVTSAMRLGTIIL